MYHLLIILKIKNKINFFLIVLLSFFIMQIIFISAICSPEIKLIKK